MIDRLTRIAALSATTFALGAPAFATAPALSEIIKGFEDRGYQITDIEVETSRIEIDALNPDGQKVDIDVDRMTGDVMNERRDD